MATRTKLLLLWLLSPLLMLGGAEAATCDTLSCPVGFTSKTDAATVNCAGDPADTAIAAR